MTGSKRLPPRQVLAAPGKWPVVGERRAGKGPEGWTLAIEGEVARPAEWSLEELQQRFPRVTRSIDIHCVTRWSLLDVPFEGVLLETLLREVAPLPSGRFIWFEARSDRRHATSVPLEDATELGTLLAWSAHGRPLAAEHGGPLRVVVPGRYFYKSLKWVERIVLLEEDRLGYWEREAGYHNRADPWREERFAAAGVDAAGLARALAERRLAGRTWRNLDVRGRELEGLDAAHATLRNADFSGSRLRRADFRGANLSGARFGGADLREACFAGADVEGADFAGADLRGADLRVASLVGTTFTAPNEPAARIDSTTRIESAALDVLGPSDRALFHPALRSDEGHSGA